jgi:hypothetical protein
MKIYIKNFIPKKIDIDFLVSIPTQYQDIYSRDGIFRIQNNNIFKLIPQDIPSETFSYNNIEFITDKSNYIFRKNIYHIPYQHIIRAIEQFEYKLYDNSEVSLITNYCKNKLVDVYFFTKKNLCTNIKNNIIEYISLINDIKQS